LNATIETMNRALAKHRYHESAQTLWDFIWHDFCDWYLEMKKRRFREASGLDEHWQAALTIYETTLRLLHPVMPFITEELWQRLVISLQIPAHAASSISLLEYPCKFPTSSANDAPFVLFQEIVTKAREERARLKLNPKVTLGADLLLKDYLFSAEDLAILSQLSKLDIRQRQVSTVGEQFELSLDAELQSA
jgi:valyl-tRNA synthetase